MFLKSLGCVRTLPRRWMLWAPDRVHLRLILLPVDVWMYVFGSNCVSGASTYGFISPLFGAIGPKIEIYVALMLRKNLSNISSTLEQLS